MLALSRLVNERVIIGDGADKITVTVIGIYGGKVRLGFDAPGKMPIHKEETYNAIKRDGDQVISLAGRR